MKSFLVRCLVAVYPSQWREEYGPELENLLLMRPLNAASVLDVLWSAARLRLGTSSGISTQWILPCVLGMTVALGLSMVFAKPIWLLVSDPAPQILREKGIWPPNLVQVTPFEQFRVVWIELPLLVSLFAAYPWLMFIARFAFAKRWIHGRKHRATRCLIYSGALFALSGVLSFVAWQYGILAGLFNIGANPQSASMISVSYYFDLFAISTLGFALLVQIPVWSWFWWQLRLRRG